MEIHVYNTDAAFHELVPIFTPSETCSETSYDIDGLVQ